MYRWLDLSSLQQQLDILMLVIVVGDSYLSLVECGRLLLLGIATCLWLNVAGCCNVL